METNVTFTNNSFSLRCGKCADIHTAQLDGKCTKPCECDCHSNITYIPYCPPTVDPCCPQLPTYYTSTTSSNTKDYTENQIWRDYNGL